METKVLAFLLMSIIVLGCSNDDEINKADLLPGYWKTQQKITVLINGIQNSESSRDYYIEFFDNNCGQFYDQDESPTSEFKWVYQEKEFYDKLLISTELNSTSSSSSGFYLNQLESIEVIEELNIQMFRDKEDKIDGDDYVYNYQTNLVKER